jgi:Flp pilus assembly CpaF family ATPase
VGEIRDLETAEIAVQASLTGHMVFSTLHTNDAPSTITRLKDMGVPTFLITATVEGDPGPAAGAADLHASAGRSREQDCSRLGKTD